MYKLVVVAGKLRGKEFELQEGENIIGRDSECDIHMPVEGISSQHSSLTITGNSCYIVDLDSSNGTFVNGKMIKRQTIQDGDKVALPDIIIQVVFVEEKKIIIKKSSAENIDKTENYFDGGSPPKILPLKLLWIFKYKCMPFLYGINEEYEWKVILGMLLSIFITITVTATIFPVLRDSHGILLNEVAERGANYAGEIVRTNRNALRKNQIERLDASFLDKEKSVKGYRLYDLEGRIIRPNELLNEYISKPFYVQVKSFYEKNKYQDKIYRKRLGTGVIGVGKLINSYNPDVGKIEPLGIIALKFSPTSLQIEESFERKAYVESFIIMVLVAIFFFLIVYYLTLRPLEEMKFQIEEAMDGNRKNLEGRWLMSELDPLRNSINTLLRRLRDLGNENGEEFEKEESDEDYLFILQEFMKGAGVPVIALDSSKNIAAVNTLAEDLTGIRENSSQGVDILEVAREKGFAATIVELCDDSANNNGKNVQGEYEIGGNNYNINVNSLIGKDGFSKAYYITFILNSD